MAHERCLRTHSVMTPVLALDVNETLSDMSALAPRLQELGAPGELLQTWFASTLRDGFALTVAGAYADFATVAHAALLALLAEVRSLSAEPGEAATQLVSAIAELPLHEDVRPGLERLPGASMGCGRRQAGGPRRGLDQPREAQLSGAPLGT